MIERDIVIPVSSPELKRLGAVADQLMTQVTAVMRSLSDRAAAPPSLVDALPARLATLTDILEQPGRGRAIPLEEVLELRAGRGGQQTDIDLAAMRASIQATPRLVSIADRTARGLDVLRVELAYWCAASAVLRHDDDDAPAIPRPALADSVRVVTEVLAARFPGRAIELRVPPFAAVQLGLAGADESRASQGPAHTRGTPPNVVEMPPLTLLRLAAGHTSWPDAIAAAGVHASGAHADLGHAWPVLR